MMREEDTPFINVIRPFKKRDGLFAYAFYKMGRGLFSLLLWLLCSLCLMTAQDETILALPVGRYIDSEVTTNCPFKAQLDCSGDFYLFLSCRATPSNNVEVALGHDDNGNGILDLDDLARDLKGFSQSFETGDGTPIKRGEAILEKISNFPDATCRTNGLAQFRKTIFALEFFGSDYAKLRSGLGSMEHLQPSYLSVAYLCGLGLDENIGYRIDFLKWLRREMARPHDADTNATARVVAGPYVSRLFVSKEAYQNSLKESYKLHLRWMEEAFNQASTLPEFSNGVDSVRLRIEQFLGRPIRTDEELCRESGMK